MESIGQSIKGYTKEQAKLICKIAVAIEEEDCTYKEAIYALGELEKYYERKGRNILDAVPIQRVAEFGGLLEGVPDRSRAKTTMEIYDHYGRQQDYEKVKAGEYSRVDFLEGKEEDIRELTADMAGFGCCQSQRVIIEYDKGYGYFLVKRIPVKYGASENAP